MFHFDEESYPRNRHESKNDIELFIFDEFGILSNRY